MLPILAGFIAMAIGDRPALALGLVGGMMAASGKSGFLGALLAGFAAGYIILGLRKLCDKLPEALEKIAPVLIYPVVGILVMGLLKREKHIVNPFPNGLVRVNCIYIEHIQLFHNRIEYIQILGNLEIAVVSTLETKESYRSYHGYYNNSYPPTQQFFDSSFNINEL